MRLTEDEKKVIVQTLQDIFGKCKIYIFGSRLDMTKRGRDIDIYVIPENRDSLYEKKLKAIVKLEQKLLKPVDLVVHYDFEKIIEQEAIKGCLLNN